MLLNAVSPTTTTIVGPNASRPFRRGVLWPAVRPVLLLMAILTALFWKITLTNQYTWMDHPDMVSQVLPWFQFQAREWHSHHVPLWDPHHRAGQTLIGQVQPGAAFPFHILLFHLPLKNGRINPHFLNWYLVFMHFLAAWFMYLLVRDVGRSVTASLIAGIAFACAGYLGEVGWPQMLNSTIWTPLVMLFSLRSARGERPMTNAALAGLFLGIAFLSGHHQIPVFVATLVTAWWAGRVATARGGMRRQAVLSVSLLLLVAFLSAAVQILPAHEYGKIAYRWVNAKEPVTWQDKIPHTVHSTFSMTPTSLLGLVVPEVHNHTSSFVGVVVVVLALFAFGAPLNSGGAALFAALPVAGVMLALGSFSVFHGLLYALMPNFDKARNPSTALYFVTMGIAGLAAYGFDALTGNSADRWIRNVLRGLGVFALILWTAVFVLQTARPAKGMEYEWGALTALTATLCLALCGMWRSGNISVRAFSALTLLLVVFQYGQQVGAYYTHREDDGYYLKKMSDTDDVAAFLHRQPGPFRIEVNSRDIPMNFGDWYGLDEVGGGVSAMVNLFRLQGDARINDLLGRRYYVGRNQPEAGSPTLVFEGRAGIKVFEYQGVQPRAWTVHEARRARSRNEAVALMQKPDLRFDSMVILQDNPPLMEQCESATPRWRSKSANTLEWDVEMRCAGMLLVSDHWAPGWKAVVSNKPVPVYEVNGFMRGVPVPAGRHHVTMTYAPRSVYLGLWLSLLGFMMPLLVSRGEPLVRDAVRY
ncbi:MAG: YfhO family protein [Bryobacterales bacterium]|nr:YfhO family protein [Bryobacterales bacterium]